jgi:hypothetical protein
MRSVRHESSPDRLRSLFVRHVSQTHNRARFTSKRNDGDLKTAPLRIPNLNDLYNGLAGRGGSTSHRPNFTRNLRETEPSVKRQLFSSSRVRQNGIHYIVQDDHSFGDRLQQFLSYESINSF